MKKVLCAIIVVVLVLTSLTATNVYGAVTAPKVTATVVTATSIRLSWKKNKDVDKYIVYRSTKQKSGYKMLKVLSKKSNSYTDKKVTFYKKYYYKIKFVKGKNTKSSKIISAKTGNASKISAEGFANKIEVKWTKQAGVSGYELYRADSKNGAYYLIYKGTKTQYSNKNLQCSSSFYYKIRAYKKSNGTVRAGKFSNSICCATNAHTYSSWTVTSDATCTESGQMSCFCTTCFKAEVNEIAPKGHDYVITDILYPSCENVGYTVYTCTKCGDTYTASYTAALGHNYDLVSMQEGTPKCIKNGSKTYKCSICGGEKTELVMPLPHDFEILYNGDGSTRKICRCCGLVE